MELRLLLMSLVRVFPETAPTDKPSHEAIAMPRDEWTAEQINELHKLLGGQPKLSATEIATLLNARFRLALHGHFTRNSVISKTHRMGWAASAPPPPKEKKKRKRKRKLKLASPPAMPAEPPPPPRDERIPLEQRRSLCELTSISCRWPVGDPCGPGFFFCGAEAVEGRAYCAGHCGVAYDSERSQRRNPRKFIERGRV